jgi:uncharacterized protein (DUF2235 family)
MPTNILIFSDGTGQAGGVRPDQHLSNIYKLYRATRIGPDSTIDPAKQIAFYDPGLGSAEIPSVGLLQLGTLIRKHLSSALGTGITRNVADCYEQILKVYEPGDRIFLFGFSRGAYTVRNVAGVINLCGVPIKNVDGTPIPRAGKGLRRIVDEAVHEVYDHGAGADRAKYELEREEKARRFRIKYGSEDEESGQNQRGNAPPYFIGVFDTVAALGAAGIKRYAILAVATVGLAIAAAVGAWALGGLFNVGYWWLFGCVLLGAGLVALVRSCMAHIKVIRDFPQKGNVTWHWSAWRFKNYDRFLDKRVRYARHAIAIDETRKDFALVGWGRHIDMEGARPDWLIQKWFAGNHSDIGGSYPETESRLSDIALQWMAKEAEGIPDGLIIDWNKLHLFPDPAGMQHCQVAEVLDMYPSWVPKRFRKSWSVARRMNILIGNCHPSVKERLALPAISKCGVRELYRPEPLRDDPELRQFYGSSGNGAITPPNRGTSI